MTASDGPIARALPPRDADAERLLDLELVDTDDVHRASTTVAALPADLIASLKDDGVLDLAPGIDADEPVTRRLDFAGLDAAPELDAPLAAIVDTTPPVIVSLPEFHLEPMPPRSARDAVSDALDAVEGEIAALPRAWKIAGAALACAVTAGALALLAAIALGGG